VLITTIAEHVKEIAVTCLHDYFPSFFGGAGAKIINKEITWGGVFTGAAIGFYIGNGVADYLNIDPHSNSAIALQFGLGLHGIGIAQESTALIVLFIKTKIIGQKNDS
jgi:hypothetical protein